MAKLKLHWGYVDGRWDVGDWPTAAAAAAGCLKALYSGVKGVREVELCVWQESADGTRSRASGVVTVEAEGA